MAIFEVRAKLGTRVRLTEVQWAHIRDRHEEMDSQLQRMVSALEDPDIVYYAPVDENYQYYKLYQETPVTEKYLLLIVKHLDGNGFVITAFFVRRIREAGKEVTYEREDLH